MSEPRLISPLLDNFVVGEPMSSHHGVRCCPAMIKDSDEKYIVKIISIPASQTQLEALLLSGAYKDRDTALSYFKELSDGIEAEIAILKKLSSLEGFLPYEGCQIVPMEDGTGYEVYLLSPYRRSLERFLRKNTMTHLGAVNLGLDLCAALSICRQAGYLYINLKPGNIYISNNREYLIGDLGFIELSSLAYASLPERYRSAYTPPEVVDAYSTLNSTMDVYAVGLILYQIFNGGVLPYDALSAGEALPSPLYADYEMAEIIQKACARDPNERWSTPIEMGQALVSYMQRNEVNDVPIVPPSADISGISPVETDVPADLDTETAEHAADDDPANLAFINRLQSDDTAPDEAFAGKVAYEELSVEMTDILSQVDDLLNHETPVGVVQPKAIDVPIPPPIKPERRENIEDIIGQTVEHIQSPPAGDAQPDTDRHNGRDDYYDDEEDYSTPRSGKRIAVFVIVLLLLAGFALGGYAFYSNYYLQPITDFVVTGSGNSMSIRIESEIDDSLLKVVYTDTYGNKRYAPVSGGRAAINDLNPNTLYTVKLEIEGFHKLTGHTSTTYNTPPQTNIITFTAVAGSEDGSVILNFTSDGQDPAAWVIHCDADGEETKSVAFTGHMVIINGLTVGKEYTFRIDSEENLYIVGQTELKYDVTSLVYAENLAVTSCSGGSLSVAWDTPALAHVASWSVRCYNNEGYDLTVSTEGNSAVFSDLDTTKAYTVEVIAQGMTTGTRCYVSANSVTITDSKISIVDATKMKVTWTYDGPEPAGNWLLLYSIDGSDKQEVVRTDAPSATISPMVPGVKYSFTVMLDDGSTVFGDSFSASTPEAKEFSGYTVDASDMTLIMVRTEDVEEMTVANWQKLSQCPFAATTFTVGQSVSIPVRLGKTYATSDDIITSLFVIRNESGELISSDYNQRTWTAMWRKFNCTLELPAIPEIPGKYTLDIYFNGLFVKTLSFEVVPA